MHVPTFAPRISAIPAGRVMIPWPAVTITTAVIAEQNPNFLNINSRQAPLSMRFGLRLIF